MHKKIILGLFITFLSSIGIFSLPAHASSEFDNQLPTTPSLLLESYQSTPTVTNISANWSSKIIASQYCSQAEVDSFHNKQNWAVFLTNYDSTSHNARTAVVTWTEPQDPQPTFYFQHDFPGATYEDYNLLSDPPNTPTHGANIAIDNTGQFIATCGPGFESRGISTGYPSVPNPPAHSTRSLFLSTFDITYPEGYDGELMPSSDADHDLDGDGLTATDETAQGTSDASKDTDGDGLSDFTESQWNPSRDSEFCSMATTPYTCTYPHPAQKDVYVQIDWMTGDKPSDTQLGMVSDAFATKGIFFHADTGQYGGGNEISSETELPFFKDSLQTDFFDIKDANFSTNRHNIWRYMISGYNGFNINDPDNGYDTTSSGLTAAGSDNIFVSYGYVYNHQPDFYITNFDTAIAGTILHEIGHSLCLSKTQAYSYQNSECQYGGIDTGDPNPLGTNAYPNYESVMNYSNQMAQVDYSNGTHASSPDDHDDWTAVGNHMSDFTQWTYSEIDSGAHSSNNSRIAVAITPSIAKKLHNKGLLRTGKSTWHHLKVKSNKR